MNTLPTLPNDWNDLNHSEQANWVTENTSFHYIYDGQDWSSGIWYSDEHGSLNNGGGSYHRMADALAGFERFAAGMAA